MLGLVAAGRGRAFELASLVEQLAFYRALLGTVHVALTPLAGTVAKEAVERLGGSIEIDPSRENGRSYYVGLCFRISAGGLELVDGGFTDWTQRLLGDRKERLLISGLGSERAAAELTGRGEQAEVPSRD